MPAGPSPCSLVSVGRPVYRSGVERIPSPRFQLEGVRCELQSCERHQLHELTGRRGRGIHPGDICGGRREWLLREKLPQADAEALEDQGLSSVSFCAGLLEIEHAVPELEGRYDIVRHVELQDLRFCDLPTTAAADSMATSVASPESYGVRAAQMVAMALSNKPDATYALACRNAILNTHAKEVQFPDPLSPELSPK